MRIQDRWDRLWFAESSLVRLAAFRIVVAALSLWIAFDLAPWNFSDGRRVTEGVTHAFLSRDWNPIYGFEVLGIRPPDATTVTISFSILIVSVLMTLVGLFTRLSAAVTAAFIFYWIGLVYSYEQAHHERIAIMLALAVLPLTPCGMRLSVDSLRSRWRRAKAGGDGAWAPDRSPFARWPILFTQISIVMGYFFAGMSKMAIVGPAWLNGYTLQAFMLGGGGPLTDSMSQNVTMAVVSSVMTLGLQLTSPILLFRPAARWLYLPALTSFHLVSWLTGIIGDTYFLMWMMFAAFLPLERVPSALGRGLTLGPVWRRVVIGVTVLAVAAGILTVYFRTVPIAFALLLVPVLWAFAISLRPDLRVDVVFDGACGLCRRSVAVLAALDWGRRIRFLDLMDWDSVKQEHPGLDRERCLREMHIIDRAGRVTAGFDGYRTLSSRIPLLFWTTPLLHLPPVAAAGRVVYQRVADARHRNGCNGSCSLIDSPRAGKNAT